MHETTTAVADHVPHPGPELSIPALPDLKFETISASEVARYLNLGSDPHTTTFARRSPIPATLKSSYRRVVDFLTDRRGPVSI